VLVGLVATFATTHSGVMDHALAKHKKHKKKKKHHKGAVSPPPSPPALPPGPPPGPPVPPPPPPPPLPPPECTLPSDCPGTDTECRSRSCVEGTCGISFVPSGIAIATQTPGDCQKVVCNGSGGTMSENDGTDLPIGGNECLDPVCRDGVPSFVPKTAGTSCTVGGQFCDGEGLCVQCLHPSDCPGSDTQCQLRTCNIGTCGLTFASNGTPVAYQTPGDCQVVVCNGTGGSESRNDDSDLPLTTNECLIPTCNQGTPDMLPKNSGTPCTGGTCDGSGTCS
jgi:hypothetical protein